MSVGVTDMFRRCGKRRIGGGEEGEREEREREREQGTSKRRVQEVDRRRKEGGRGPKKRGQWTMTIQCVVVYC